MVVGFMTTYTIIAYHHWSCGFKCHSWRNVLDIVTLCDAVCQWLEVGCWFSPDTPISSTNKPDRHDITAILLKVSLKAIYSPSLNISHCINIQYWCIDGKYRIYVARPRNGGNMSFSKSFHPFHAEPHKFYIYRQYTNIVFILQYNLQFFYSI